jgi:hypothetical protein
MYQVRAPCGGRPGNVIASRATLRGKPMPRALSVIKAQMTRALEVARAAYGDNVRLVILPGGAFAAEPFTPAIGATGELEKPALAPVRESVL